ncbi:MAG: VanW family protein [Clostridia bacterium]|nr:VanW family protein [Clostridia bacterium]
MTKTKSLLIFALAAVVAGAIFLPTTAYAYQPWQVDVTLQFDGKSFHYSLWQNAQHLDDSSLQNRGVYLGLKGKNQLVNQLINQGFTFRQSAYYVLVGIGDLLEEICSYETQRRDAVVQFCPQSKQKFVYSAGTDGIAVDIDATLRQILAGRRCFEVPTIVDKAVTISHLKQQTVLRAGFVTTFNQGNANRVCNLKVCADKLSGTVVSPGEQFSFNKVVGERTKSNGFVDAKVILDGSYVDGVGGGVCQVSGTLYNAVLLADLPVTTLYQHSLVSTYVPPSFDAMVSYPNADFCFVNNTDAAIYVHCFVEGNRLVVELYGSRCPYQIERQSVVLSRIPAEVAYKQATPADNLAEGEERVVTNGSDYVKSQAYLVYYKDGKLVKRVKIRQNEYKMSPKVVLVGR